MTDPSGHGTWLAGIIAARTGGASPDGIAGVAYDGVRIMPVTVLNANGEGLDSDVIAGVIWAVDHGAHVILMAFSNPGFSPALQEAIDYAWSRGVVLVALGRQQRLEHPGVPGRRPRRHGRGRHRPERRAGRLQQRGPGGLHRRPRHGHPDHELR